AEPGHRAVDARGAQRVDVRVTDDHLPGRPAADPRGALRGGPGGRRREAAAVLQRDDAAAHPDHLLQPRAADDRCLPGVHPGPHHLRRPGRTPGLHAVLHALPVPTGFPELQHGLRVGDGVGAARRHRRGDRGALPAVEVLGFLRGRAMRAGLRHAVMCVLVVLMIYPLIWMLVSSFKPSNLVLSEPGLIPSEVTFDNYRDGWDALDEPFSLFFLNSLFVSVGSIVGNLFSCSLAAYALARL